MFGGIGILLLFLLAGEALALLGVPLPGNVIGMILITIALATGRLSMSRVERAAATLLDNLAFFFVPPAVGVIVHARLLGRNIVAVTVAVILAAVIVFVVTGLTAQTVIRLGERRSGGGTHGE